jgi:hypothetical protein
MRKGVKGCLNDINTWSLFILLREMSFINRNSINRNSIKPHYLLKLFVDSDDTKLSTFYKEAIRKHNTIVQMYLDDVESDVIVHFDAGFDLFCPKACIIEGKETGKLNHNVKTAMEFRGLCPPTPGLIGYPPAELMSALEFIVSTTANNTTANNTTANNTTANNTTANNTTANNTTANNSENNNYIRTSPVGYYLYPRSSTGTKTPLRLANSVGIIDSGYRGHIIAVFDNWKEENYCIEPYQRMVQLCPPNLTYPVLVQLVESEEELGLTRRGAGGFGSTGN